MSKKLFGLLLTLVMLFSFTNVAMAVPTVFINGQQLLFDVSPVIENERTLVPLRAIFESLGAEVAWDEYTQTITAVKGTNTIRIQIGNITAQKNNEPIELDVPAKIINGRTLVPLRFVSEALGADVKWEGSSQTITIIDSVVTPTSKDDLDNSKIPVGVNLELTGPVGSYGNSAKQGIELAVKQINADGGVLGKQLMLIVKDNMSASDQSQTASAALVANGITAQIGPLTSGNCMACSPVLIDSKIPLLCPAATAPMVTVDTNGNTLDYVFRISFVDPFQGTLMAQFAAYEFGAKKAAIFKAGSSDYGNNLADYFKTTFEENGGSIIAEETFEMGDKDFEAALTRIKSKNPDFLYVPGYYPEVAPLIKQARELGIRVAIGGGDGWDSPSIVDIAGHEALNNTYFINHYSSQDDPQVVSFIAAYKANFNEEPDAFAALGYDAVQILKRAIEDAGAADSIKIKDALSNLKDFEGVTGKMSFDEQHNPIKSGVVIEFIDGKQVMKTRIYPE